MTPDSSQSARACSGDRACRAATHIDGCLTTCVCPPGPYLAMGCPVHDETASSLVAEAFDRDKLITRQPADVCELCGTKAELRPYGPNGERICFPCGPGSGDPNARKAAERAFERRLA